MKDDTSGIQLDSFTFTVTDPNGFDGLYCIRQRVGEADSDFEKRVTAKSEWLKLGLYTPKKFAARGGGVMPVKEKDWTGDKCPTDGGRLYKMTTKSGKTMVKCENSRWDFATRTASGCPYIAWI